MDFNFASLSDRESSLVNIQVASSVKSSPCGQARGILSFESRTILTGNFFGLDIFGMREEYGNNGIDTDQDAVHNTAQRINLFS